MTKTLEMVIKDGLKGWVLPSSLSTSTRKLAIHIKRYYRLIPKK